MNTNIGRHLLGAIQPIHDPDEDKYALRNRPLKVSPPHEVSLPEYAFQPIATQTMGSCAAVSSTVAAAMSEAIARKTNQTRYSNSPWLYFWGRVKGGLMDISNPNTWMDSGSYINVNLDILKDSAPQATSPDELVGDPKWRPSPEIESTERIDQVLSYAPFYPTTEGLASLCTALDNGMAVVLGMFWPDPFFNPIDGILPEVTRALPGTGAHAVACGRVIAHNGKLYPVGINQWSANWNQQIRNLGDNRLRPGEFLIPESVFTSLVFQAEAVTHEAFNPIEPQDDQVDISQLRVNILQVADAARDSLKPSNRVGRKGAQTVIDHIYQPERWGLTSE